MFKGRTGEKESDEYFNKSQRKEISVRPEKQVKCFNLPADAQPYPHSSFSSFIQLFTLKCFLDSTISFEQDGSFSQDKNHSEAIIGKPRTLDPQYSDRESLPFPDKGTVRLNERQPHGVL